MCFCFREIPWLCFYASASASASVSASASASASFRVNPWQILPLILSSASVFSVKFRVNPWLIFSLLLPLLGVYSVLKITMVGLGKLGRISQFFVAS